VTAQLVELYGEVIRTKGVRRVARV
jgi:hypothetical protein